MLNIFEFIELIFYNIKELIINIFEFFKYSKD